MALSKTVETPQGFTATDAYHRVESVGVTKTNVSFQVISYLRPDKPAFQHQSYSCPYDLNGTNPIQQAYAYLKDRPEWAGSVDV